MNSSRRIVVSASFLLCALAGGRAQQGARIELFTPQGTVRDISQVSARFSEAMVAFGDPRAKEPPFEMTCTARGSGRWVDPRNWVFYFEATLPAGIRCEFRLRDGLRTLAGREIGGAKSFAFSTGGPAVTASNPSEGSTIEEEQAFLLELDGEASEESLLKNSYFTVAGIAGRVAVRLVAAREREAVLRAEFAHNEEKLKSTLGSRLRYPLLQARQRFPAGAKVSLVWGRGISSTGGIANEDDQVLPFEVRTPFTATFGCSRMNADAQCVPITPLRLSFSAPVSWSAARRITLRGPGGKVWRPSVSERNSEEGGFVSGVTFKGPFPERAVLTLEIPGGLQDDSGRRLSNAGKFPMRVQTDSYPPLAKFAADFGILELNANPMLPVTLRNIEPSISARMFEVAGGEGAMDPPQPAPREGAAGSMRGRMIRVPPDKASQMIRWIQKVESRGWEDRDKSIFGPVTSEKANRFSIPKLEGPKSFEVVGIPIKSPGFYVVEIESELLGAGLLGEKKPMYVPTTVLVTNLAVHFKRGVDSSLVWVTTLDDAKPVPSAEIIVRDCQGAVQWQGKTEANGLARPRITAARNSRECSGDRYGQGMLVTAQSGSDMSFVHSSWDDGIESWRFQLPTGYESRPTLAHTVLDRPLFRAGETVHMKHFLRRHNTAGVATPAPADLGKTVTILHIGSDQRYELPVQWDAQGIAETEWAIPREARLGEYEVTLARQAKDDRHPPSALFRVEEFRVPLMRGSIRPPSEPLVMPPSVPIDLTVQYLGGGGASALPVRFRYELRPSNLEPFEGFYSFAFSRGRVREGITRGERERQPAERSEIQRQDLTLDGSGSVRTAVTSLPKIERPMEIAAELEFQDPNGEKQTVSSNIPIYASARHIGISRRSWMASKDGLKLQVAVTTIAGKPVAGAPVRVDLFQRKLYSHRKRLVGGFYAYEHSTEVKRVQVLCEGKTDARGLMPCEKPLPVSGSIFVQATTPDEQGREAATYEESWIAGGGEMWFRAEDGDRIDLIPEARRYEPGSQARFQVRMPFRFATALITVEREGVADAYVREISGKDPVIEVPVKNTYAPNIFVSALVVRGRAGDVQPTATVDLGRPAYKLGIAEINVGWRGHELKVKVNPEKNTYKVRDKARVAVSVTTADGKAPPRGAEIAVAAVDEGLLELMPNRSWELLEAMMSRRSYEVQTSTAQMHIVGRRHFGLKALPQGGGGGRQVTRELFDTLLLWKGRVALDARGSASLEIPLNDSITSFRIAAVANAGTGLFGTSAASIRSTQDLMIFSGLPPVVRQGDTFRAEFTLRNAGEKPMDVRVGARVKPLARAFSPLNLAIPPGESRQAAWDITAPPGTDALQYEIDASGGEGAADRLAISQRVAAAIPVRTFQATISQLDKEVLMDVEQPRDALPGLGGVQVIMRPSLLGSLGGVTDYMRRYPYTCLEQEVSKAIALKDDRLWNKIAARLPAYLDDEGLAKYFPSSREGSDALTSYFLSVAHEAGREIPEKPLDRMLSGLRGFVEGRVVRYGSLPTADLAIRKMAAIEALSRWSDKMPAVPGRAGGQNWRVSDALLSSFAVEPNLWPTSAVIDWYNVLRRTPTLANRDGRLGEAEQILRSRLSFQGTTMGFSTERQDVLSWLMVTADANALRFLLAVMEAPVWKEDIPRLVRGVLGRQQRGAWDITVANAWGTLAMDRFANVFETVSVTGSSTVSVGGAAQQIDWSATPAGSIVSFDWPAGRVPLRIGVPATGKPWATIQSLAAIPLRQPLSAGFRIRKTMVPVEQKQQGVWSRGDLVRVRLELESQADMTWVVVSDPIPAGASILGTGLGRDSRLAVQSEERTGWNWPVFEERSFEAFRSYYDYIPKGAWTIEYTMRFNGQGVMNLPSTRVEAMYSPEAFAEIPNEPVRIQ